MTLLHYLYLYVLTVPVFFTIDMLWLGVIAKSFYQRELVDFLGPVNWPAAIIFLSHFYRGYYTFCGVARA